VLAASELHAAGLVVAVVNPRQVREFVGWLGRMGKTDRLDALVLAQFAQSAHSNDRLPKLHLPNAAEAELKALVTRRRQLVAMLIPESNRRERAPKVIRRSIVASIRGLKRAIADRATGARGAGQLSGAAGQGGVAGGGARSRRAAHRHLARRTARVRKPRSAQNRFAGWSRAASA
jgi:transposase